jgi:large repetitive protein
MKAPTQSPKHLAFRVSTALLSLLTVAAVAFIPSVASAATAKSPSSPLGVAAKYVQGATTVTVSWKAPVDNTPASSYIVLSNTGGLQCDTSALSCVISPLVPGTTYTFTATAHNSYGSGPTSNPSAPITATLLPGPVSNLVTAYTPGSTSLTANWAIPTAGYPDPTSYAVALSNGTSTTTTALTYTFTGLTPGQSYTISVTATNSVGVGPSASTSPPVEIEEIPTAPVDVSASLNTGSTSATINWSPPNTSFPAPTSYTVTSSPGGLSCTTSSTSCEVSGLTLSTSYTFSVTATNAVGTGPAGTSNTLSTGAALDHPGTPTFPALKANVRQVTLSWAASANCGADCTYAVYANGTQITTTSATHVTVTKLALGSSYTFTVTASSSSKGTSTQSGTSKPVTPWIDALGRGASLTPGHFLFSPNRQYHLSILPNGRLAVVKGKRNHWVAPGGTGTRLTLTTSGNVEFTSGAAVKWASHTRSPGAPVLEITNTGALELLNHGRFVWSNVKRPRVPVPVRTTTPTQPTHPVTTTTVHRAPPTTTTVPGVPIP